MTALMETGCVADACDAAGMSRTTAYAWRMADVEFAAAWDAALRIGAEALEDIARQRAKEGSDTLLIFLLKGAFPEKYRERRETVGVIAHQGADGAGGIPGAATVNVTIAGEAAEVLPEPVDNSDDDAEQTR